MSSARRLEGVAVCSRAIEIEQVELKLEDPLVDEGADAGVAPSNGKELMTQWRNPCSFF